MNKNAVNRARNVRSGEKIAGKGFYVRGNDGERENENISIRMFDLQGRQQMIDVYSDVLGKAKLNLSNLCKGVYILELNNGGKITKRVIVE